MTAMDVYSETENNSKTSKKEICLNHEVFFVKTIQYYLLYSLHPILLYM